MAKNPLTPSPRASFGPTGRALAEFGARVDGTETAFSLAVTDESKTDSPQIHNRILALRRGGLIGRRAFAESETVFRDLVAAGDPLPGYVGLSRCYLDGACRGSMPQRCRRGEKAGT